MLLMNQRKAVEPSLDKSMTLCLCQEVGAEKGNSEDLAIQEDHREALELMDFILDCSVLTDDFDVNADAEVLEYLNSIP
jgi:hypothetical protein